MLTTSARSDGSPAFLTAFRGRGWAAASALRCGVPFGIHSDAPITPLAPLLTAWGAVNRRTASGRVLGKSESITVEDALYAITLGAAYTLRRDHEIGSVEVGKLTDFDVVEDNPARDRSMH